MNGIVTLSKLLYEFLKCYIYYYYYGTLNKLFKGD